MKVLKLEDATNKDMVGCKIIESPTHIGWHNFRLKCTLKCVVLSKHPLHRTMLFLVHIGRLRMRLYNYCSMISFHKSKLIYGVHILFLRLVWARY